MKIETLTLTTKFYNYNIYFGRNINLETVFSNCVDNKIFIITDSIVNKLYETHLREQFKNFNFEILVINVGEESKDFFNYRYLITELLNKNIQKDDLIVSFGGGVIGDLVGFVAGTILRGVEFVNIPTTLLAMVDSSIGGKTGINTIQGKNLIGTYKQPLFVVVDVNYLKTLKKTEYVNGLAEVIKAGFIFDKDLITGLIEKSLSDEEIIKRAILIKKQIVEKDPYEENERFLLNFGHTFAHAIEKANNYKLKHGNCVIMGMDLALKFGLKNNFTKPNVLDDFKKILKAYQYKTFKGDANLLINYIKYDKKKRKNILNFVIIEETGKGKIVEIGLEDLYDLSN